jgi:hypothetical protein
MARQHCRWIPDQKMIGLRFSDVMDPSEYADFPSFENDPASASGTCGPTSTLATAPRPPFAQWAGNPNTRGATAIRLGVERPWAGAGGAAGVTSRSNTSERQGHHE